MILDPSSSLQIVYWDYLISDNSTFHNWNFNFLLAVQETFISIPSRRRIIIVYFRVLGDSLVITTYSYYPNHSLVSTAHFQYTHCLPFIYNKPTHETSVVSCSSILPFPMEMINSLQVSNVYSFSFIITLASSSMDMIRSPSNKVLFNPLFSLNPPTKNDALWMFIHINFVRIDTLCIYFFHRGIESTRNCQPAHYSFPKEQTTITKEDMNRIDYSPIVNAIMDWKEGEESTDSSFSYDQFKTQLSLFLDQSNDYFNILHTLYLLWWQSISHSFLYWCTYEFIMDFKSFASVEVNYEYLKRFIEDTHSLLLFPHPTLSKTSNHYCNCSLRSLLNPCSSPLCVFYHIYCITLQQNEKDPYKPSKKQEYDLNEEVNQIVNNWIQ